MLSNVFPSSFLSRMQACFTTFALALAIASTSALAQGSREVTLIDPPQPTPADGTIEVLEFFSYGCVHCANLEPPLEAWKKQLPPDVKFRRVPSGFNLGGLDEISVFHTLEAMGQLDRLHRKLFDALHTERAMLGHKPTFLKWLEKNGIDPKQYETVEKSFSVQTKVMRGRQLASQYKITNTPTIVVGGRFALIQTGGAANFLAAVDRTVAQLRAQSAPRSAAPAPRPPTKN
jgi:protein dithiol oxidoreductase (disulfide-forming)